MKNKNRFNFGIIILILIGALMVGCLQNKSEQKEIVSGLDLVKNPEAYIGKEVSVNDAFLGSWTYERTLANSSTPESAVLPVISARESSRSDVINLEYYYPLRIGCPKAHITGVVMKNSPEKQGFIPENKIYYFNISNYQCS